MWKNMEFDAAEGKETQAQRGDVVWGGKTREREREKKKWERKINRKVTSDQFSVMNIFSWTNQNQNTHKKILYNQPTQHSNNQKTTLTTAPVRGRKRITTIRE